MLPKEQFIAGLVSFLFAHVAYIVGLNPFLPLSSPSCSSRWCLHAGGPAGGDDLPAHRGRAASERQSPDCGCR